MSVEPRMTRQRRAILEALTATGEFRSAQQLHAQLKAQGQAIGLATVYRALARMAETGDVDSLMLPEGETGYRRCSSGHHHHLVCHTCGLTIEVAGPSVEAWARTTAERHGFADVRHTLEIFGQCPACQNQAAQTADH